MEKGRTAKILTPFLDGMKKAGASVELFYAKKFEHQALYWGTSLLEREARLLLH